MAIPFLTLQAIAGLKENIGFNMLLQLAIQKQDQLLNQLAVPASDGPDQDLRLLNLWRGMKLGMINLTNLVNEVSKDYEEKYNEYKLKYEFGGVQPETWNTTQADLDKSFPGLPSYGSLDAKPDPARPLI